MTMSKLVGFRWPALAVAGILALVVLSDPAAKSNKRAVMVLSGADAPEIDRAARDFRMPDQIEWKGRPGSANQSATLFGDPSKPGFVVQLLKRGPNDWAQPHTHPNDRILTVLAGTMLIGTGSKFDKENTVALGPGSIVKDFANQTHFDGSGPDGLTLEIVTMGPLPAGRGRGQ
ncbi:MAG TPA: cupin domain-containing protein [Bryobacteraceae bacterium]|nr:cupin domain-containing protein [Bryobacteraceae bacterium]